MEDENKEQLENAKEILEENLEYEETELEKLKSEREDRETKEEHLGNVKKVMEAGFVELEEEGKATGEILSKDYPEAKKELKRMILEKAEISEKDFDNYVETQQYHSQENEVDKAKRILDGARELTKKQKEVEENEKRKEKERENIYQELKKNPDLISGLSDDEILDRAKDISDEATRVYGEPNNSLLFGKRKRDKYLREIMEGDKQDLEETLKNKKEKELEKKEEEKADREYIASGQKAKDDAIVKSVMGKFWDKLRKK
jgi:hypothetical protein